MGIFNSIFGGNNNNEDLTILINEGAFLVDVRTAAEFAEGNVAGSTNIPLDQVANKIDRFKGKKNIIVFCRSGSRSSQAKAILEQNGFNNVTNGGSWQEVNASLKNK
ncbi:rhodanese-like domain-containing protein [Flavobacterium sp.]|uniref:rhodanese-like domain-containing protein n=1 Tax=Flavobacterium sp. TaxID=239 RepID=UPI00286EB18C|nr:rhodanese-like domain-containing protein [Flavobacterium sp.]